jgi:hypothetical protein
MAAVLPRWFKALSPVNPGGLAVALVITREAYASRALAGFSF